MVTDDLKFIIPAAGGGLVLRHLCFGCFNNPPHRHIHPVRENKLKHDHKCKNANRYVDGVPADCFNFPRNIVNRYN